MYFLSKLFWFLARPGNLVLLVLLAGTLAAWLRPGGGGRLWLTLVSAFLLLVTLAPLDSWITRPLENRFPPPAALPERVDGIVVLGGAFQAALADDRKALAVSENAERYMAAAALARQHPGARLVFSGRSENHESLRAWFAAMGLEGDRITYETAARNTYENAVMSRDLVRPGGEEVWLLVTSAQHIPRAVGVFRKADWKVIPYPVDFQTAQGALPLGWPDMAANLAAIGDGLKEWAGLLAYYALGRTDEAFPAPRQAEGFVQ